MDEPFFAPFLKVSGKDHPGREETLAAHKSDPNEVAMLCRADVPQTYHFQKHMPHHMLAGFPMEWAEGAKNFFLIRHPKRVIASYAKNRAEFSVEDLGFAPQSRLWDALGRPPVIHSETILANPEFALRALCDAIQIPFDTAMLSWPAGSRPEDGAWAPWWYESVERSTGFGAPSKEMPEVSSKYIPLLTACLDDYSHMAAQALKV